MSPAHVLEPTYRRLKEALLEGKWSMGAKLEAQRIADDFGVSMTPVRDSLNQLAGERLVDFTPGEGYRVALLNEQALRDMLGVNRVLLLHSVRNARSSPELSAEPAESAGYAIRVASVFARLAQTSGNNFLVRSVGQISEILHPVRRLEQDRLPDAWDTLALLEASLEAQSAKRRQAIERYHDRCLEYVPTLIAALGEG